MEAGIVGRSAELDRIATFLHERPSEPRALLLRGEAGIGKTTLWREGVRLALALGFVVLLAQPSESETALLFAVLGDLFAGLGNKVLARLPRPQRIAVESALARGESTKPPDTHALSRGVLEVLLAEGSGGRLLLAIDDVQWVDRSTASVLAFALRRLGTAPVRLLIAERSTGARQAELPLRLDSWQSGVDQIEVGPLSTTELGGVVRGYLGEALPRPRIESLERESGGNPMFALELARHAARTDAAIAPPSTLAQALEARIDALDPEGRAAVSVAAAALTPSTELLARADVSQAGIQSALDADILALDGEHVSFTHPLLASVGYGLLSPDGRRRIHERLAAASARPLERGHHVARSAASASDSAADALDAAAAEAAELGDHAGAAEFLLRASELSPRPDDAARWRRVHAAVELETAGDTVAAARLARALRDELPAGLPRAQARQTLVSCDLGTSLSYDECLAELSLALEDAREDDATAARIHVALADMTMTIWRLDDSLEHLRAATGLAERAGATDIAVDAVSETGFVESMLGRGVSENALGAFERWNGNVESPNSYSPRLSLACARFHAAELDEAARLFADELAMAQERGLEPVEVLARFHLSEVQTRAGAWSDALVNARVAVEHARQAANAQVTEGAVSVLAAVEALLGDHDAARTLVTEGLALAERMDDLWYATMHRAVLGLVALTEDDADTAIELLEPAWATMQERGIGNPSIFPVAHVLGETLAARGRFDEALLVAEALRASPAHAHPWCRAMAPRVEALVASHRGDHPAARAAIDEALAAHADLPEPFEHARTLHVQGRIERRARNWASARAALEAALTKFDGLGAARWAEKAAADLARLPGRKPSARGELTATERRVAALVAEGLSNKEVAARLFVSVRAVEANLSKIYAKLGVRSRTELAHRLKDEADS